MATALIFRRKAGFPMPHGGVAGHVGWAFELKGGGFYCGSTENLNCMPWHPAGGDNGWWASEVSDFDGVAAKMRECHYTDFKSRDIESGNPERARDVADNCRQIGYSFTGNNCVDHVYQIIVHFGAIDLPLPLDIGYPNGWFSAIPWTYQTL
jgi:hypothetical protein